MGTTTSKKEVLPVEDGTAGTVIPTQEEKRQVYYKVLRHDKCHRGFQYKDGLNVMDPIKEKFEAENYMGAGFHFVDAPHIARALKYGTQVYEVALPYDDPNFKMVGVYTRNVSDIIEWRANMIILAPLSPISDISDPFPLLASRAFWPYLTVRAFYGDAIYDQDYDDRLRPLIAWMESSPRGPPVIDANAMKRIAAPGESQRSAVTRYFFAYHTYEALCVSMERGNIDDMRYIHSRFPELAQFGPPSWSHRSTPLLESVRHERSDLVLYWLHHGPKPDQDHLDEALKRAAILNWIDGIWLLRAFGAASAPALNIARQFHSTQEETFAVLKKPVARLIKPEM